MMKIEITSHFDPEQISQGDIVIVNIPHKAIKDMDLTLINQLVSVLNTCGQKAREKILLLFEGWDDDPREIYEIEEIRKWVSLLVDKHPYFFYFTTREFDSTSLLMTCISDFTSISSINNSHKKLVTYEVPDNFNRICEALVSYATRNNDPVREIRRLIYSLTPRELMTK